MMGQTSSLVVTILFWSSTAYCARNSSWTPERRRLDDRSEGYNGESERQGELTPTDLTVAACIVLCLIFFTILFEEGKHRVEQSVPHEKIVMVERIFGELTILGFLAMLIFVLSPFLELLSHRIEEEELDQYLEHIHYALFSVMVFFVLQVWVLMRAAHVTEQQWDTMEPHCQQKQQQEMRISFGRRRSSVPVALSLTEREALANLRQSGWYTWLLPQLFDPRAERKRDAITYASLRNEFLLERSPVYPYSPLPTERQLDPDFHFGRYLGLCQVAILTQVVQVQHTTWMCFAAGTILYYMSGLLLKGHWIAMAWVWVVIGWAVFLFNAVFERHLNELRDCYLPKRLTTMLHQQPSSTEMAAFQFSRASALLKEEPDLEELPAYLVLEAEGEASVQHHSWKTWVLSFCIVPPGKSVLDRDRPDMYLLILQLNLIFTGVYVACLVFAYGPAIVQQGSIAVSVTYAVLGGLPVLGITYNKKRLVATLTQCLSLGPHRKLHVIADVLRETKTQHAVGSLLFICAMRRQASSDFDSTRRLSVSVYNKSELKEAGRLLRHMSADDFLTQDELDAFFARLDLPTTREFGDSMIQALDGDGDGRVTRTELIDWYARHLTGTMEEQAKEMFQLFDANGDGTITLSEFKNRVDALELGFTMDEVGWLLNELDTDRNGSISCKEFESMLRKYYPRALAKHRAVTDDEDHWFRAVV